MSILNQDPHNKGVSRATSFGNASAPVAPTASPLNQIKGLAARGSTGAGIPKHVTNVAAYVAQGSVGTSSAVTVTFSRDPSDTAHSKVNVYVRGFQGNKSPVQVASGSESPVTFVINNTGESISVLVQAQGNSGEAPLDTAPSTGVKLAQSTAGGYSTNTVTVTKVQPPVEVEYFAGPGVTFPPIMIAVVNKSIVPAVANAVICTRFTMKQSITVNKITWNIQAASAGKHVAFGIYSADGNTRVIDSGALSAAATGIVTAAISGISLSAGTPYWFVQTSDSVTPTGPAVDSAISVDRLYLEFSNSSARYGRAANDSVAGALPTTLGTITAISTVGGACGVAMPLFEE